MTDLVSLVTENVAKIITSIATAGLIALFTYIYKTGSWTKDHRRARMYELQGDNCFNGGMFTPSVEQYRNAIKIWEQEMNQHRMLIIYQKMGRCYRKLDDTEHALEALTHCEMLWDAIKKDIKIQDIYFELSQVYLSKGNLEKASHYIEQAVIILRKQTSPRLPIALSLAARIAKDRGRLEEAESEYVEAIGVLDDIGDTLGLASIYYELGDLKRGQQREVLAEQYYRKSADAYERLGSGRAAEIRARLIIN